MNIIKTKKDDNRSKSNNITSKILLLNRARVRREIGRRICKKISGDRTVVATVIKIRMVKIKLPDGVVEILLTNLYDEKLFTLADLKQLYGLR